MTARNGIYFGLDEALYHADPALGSSSMKQLAYSPPDYWYNSPHNKTKIEKEDTPAQILGTAFHKFVLEGEKAFRERYAPITEDGRTKAGKEEKAAIEAAGQIGLNWENWQRVLLAGAAIGSNHYLANAFSGGPTEVSIFWTAPHGVPKKARIDCLKMRANVDLKTIAPMDGQEFPDVCRRAIGSYHYNIQAEHYNEGRSKMLAFVKDGLVFGDHDPAQLKDMARSTAWTSIFVFLKKTGAPLTWGCSISQKNTMLEIARASIAKATDHYLDFRDRLGFDTPWLTTDPIEELAIEDMPGYWRPL